MPGEADDPLAQQLLALRREYLADSVERVGELRRLLERATRGEATALAELRRAFHRLAGSGGSYGFPAVSSRSREGEQVALSLEAGAAPVPAADLASLAAIVEAIDRAFAEARRAFDAGSPG